MPALKTAWHHPPAKKIHAFTLISQCSAQKCRQVHLRLNWPVVQTAPWKHSSSTVQSWDHGRWNQNAQASWFPVIRMIVTKLETTKIVDKLNRKWKTESLFTTLHWIKIICIWVILVLHRSWLHRRYWRILANSQLKRWGMVHQKLYGTPLNSI